MSLILGSNPSGGGGQLSDLPLLQSSSTTTVVPSSYSTRINLYKDSGIVLSENSSVGTCYTFFNEGLYPTEILDYSGFPIGVSFPFSKTTLTKVTDSSWCETNTQIPYTLNLDITITLERIGELYTYQNCDKGVVYNNAIYFPRCTKTGTTYSIYCTRLTLSDNSYTVTDLLLGSVTSSKDSDKVSTCTLYNGKIYIYCSETNVLYIVNPSAWTSSVVTPSKITSNVSDTLWSKLLNNQGIWVDFGVWYEPDSNSLLDFKLGTAAKGSQYRNVSSTFTYASDAAGSQTSAYGLSQNLTSTLLYRMPGMYFTPLTAGASYYNANSMSFLIAGHDGTKVCPLYSTSIGIQDSYYSIWQVANSGGIFICKTSSASSTTYYLINLFGNRVCSESLTCRTCDGLVSSYFVKDRIVIGFHGYTDTSVSNSNHWMYCLSFIQ